MHLDMDGFKTYLGRNDEPGPSGKPTLVSSEGAVGGPAGFVETGAHTSSRIMHRENFIEAVRKADPLHLTADVLEGHYSSSLCHLANISQRLGRQLDFDPRTERFIADEQADGYLSKIYRQPYAVGEEV